MRRDAIYYVFTHCLGAQEESLWDDIRTVTDMMRRRSILSGTQESEARPLHRDAEHAVDLICSGGRALPEALLYDFIQTFLNEKAEDE